MIHWMAMVPWIVLVLVLLWRVVRIEGEVKRLWQQGEFHWECIGERAHKSGVNALSERVAGDLDAVKSLASSLGYEWKSTPAKSGWERKASPFGFKPLMGEAREEAIRSIEHAINTTPNPFCSARIRYYESGDRRKADRRKPAPQAAPKSPPKKRRAH